MKCLLTVYFLALAPFQVLASSYNKRAKLGCLSTVDSLGKDLRDRDIKKMTRLVRSLSEGGQVSIHRDGMLFGKNIIIGSYLPKETLLFEARLNLKTIRRLALESGFVREFSFSFNSHKDLKANLKQLHQSAENYIKTKEESLNWTPGDPRKALEDYYSNENVLPSADLLPYQLLARRISGDHLDLASLRRINFEGLVSSIFITGVPGGETRSYDSLKVYAEVFMSSSLTVTVELTELSGRNAFFVKRSVEDPYHPPTPFLSRP